MRTFAPLLLASLFLAGCDRTPQAPASKESQPAAEQSTVASTEQSWQQALLEEAQQAHAALQSATDQLALSIDQFLAEPNNDSHKAARDAWRQAHQAYKAVRFYQFLGLTPPAPEQSPQGSHPLLSRLDLHPLEPGYLDSVEGYPFSGLVYSESVPLTPESLNEQHQFSDTAYIVYGFHPIEFLLWGENRNQQTRRSWHDFQHPSQDPATAESNQSLNEHSTAKLRRRQLLSAITITLTQDIETLVQAWQVPNGSYASQFLKLSPKDQQTRVRHALIRTLQEDVNAPLKAALAIAKRQEAQPPESAFSQNGRGDLLATLGSLKIVLATRSTATLALTEEQQNTAAELYRRLLDEIAQLKAPLVDTVTPPKTEHLEQIRQTQALTAQLLELLDGKMSGPAQVQGSQ